MSGVIGAGLLALAVWGLVLSQAGQAIARERYTGRQEWLAGFYWPAYVSGLAYFAVFLFSILSNV